MAENSENNDRKDGKDPKRKIVRVRINFSWFYILLILAIGWMLFSQNGTQPAKIEWAEVQSIFKQGDILVFMDFCHHHVAPACQSKCD